MAYLNIQTLKGLEKKLIFILLLCYTYLKISSCSKYISLEYNFSHS